MLKEPENGSQVSDILICMRDLHEYRYATLDMTGGWLDHTEYKVIMHVPQWTCVTDG